MPTNQPVTSASDRIMACLIYPRVPCPSDTGMDFRKSDRYRVPVFPTHGVPYRVHTRGQISDSIEIGHDVFSSGKV